MYKRAISIFLVIVLSVSMIPSSVIGKEKGDIVYTTEQKEQVYRNYFKHERMMNSLFCDDSSIAYWSEINNITNKYENISWWLDRSSMLIGEYPDKKKYAEILANLMMMQEGDLAEQIENQSSFDDLKSGEDYVLDIVDIAFEFVGASDIKELDEVMPIIDVATGGKDIVVSSVEEVKYYETSIKDYSRFKKFLEAVNTYAENQELRDVASSLLKANKILLQKRLEFFSDEMETLGDFAADFFIKNFAFDLLKEVDIYNEDENVKWFVDNGEKLKGVFSSVKAAGGFTFKMMMLAGDIGFGTSDTFNRYQEMKVVSDITSSLVKANDNIRVSSNANSEKVFSDIRAKCDYYSMIIATHARGEYLLYQLLINDAGLLSQFRVLFDYFKEPGQTTTGWYQNQISVLTEYSRILDDMFLASAEGKIDNQDQINIQEPVRSTSGERDIVLVLDDSGSMYGSPLEETKKAASKFVNTILKEDASIGLVTYDNYAECNADFSVDGAYLKEEISKITDGGTTNIEDGLSMAQSMLQDTHAKKKIIVLMSDGAPNVGKEGDELIEYADNIKDKGIIIYTLGFFEHIEESKSSAQLLMEQLASDGCHYEVENAEDLVFFFEDIADQISGQKYIYIRIACPVDVLVESDGQVLSSAEHDLNLRTDFGTLTFEDNQQNVSEGKDNRIKVLRLKEGIDYDVKITGTGRGIMNYTIGFMDENGEYSDLRKFEDVKITKRTVIDTVASVSDKSNLYIDEDGDGKYDIAYQAGENEYAEEVQPYKQYIFIVAGCGCGIVLFIIIILCIKKKQKRKVRS